MTTSTSSTMGFSIHILLKTLMGQKGSDLHIAKGSPPRIRVNGKLLSLDSPPLSAAHCRSLCYSILSE